MHWHIYTSTHIMCTRSWLRGMGARGLELLQVGKRSGVWLKPNLTDAELEALARGKKVIEASERASVGSWSI